MVGLLFIFISQTTINVKKHISQQCEISQQTWKSPDERTINQIDHVLIDVRHKSSVMDVKSLRGAEC